MALPKPPEGTLLLLIDLQLAIDQPSWGERNNPDAEAKLSQLLQHWRERGWPVWHVRHDSSEAGSHYRPDLPTHAFKPEALPLPGEVVIAKTTNSAFIGTDLEQRLRSGGHARIIIAGVITNNSVEATVRMAGNLGFETYLLADVCFTFGRKDWNGVYRSAEEVHALALANMDGEYCRVTTSAVCLS